MLLTKAGRFTLAVEGEEGWEDGGKGKGEREETSGISTSCP